MGDNTDITTNVNTEGRTLALSVWQTVTFEEVVVGKESVEAWLRYHQLNQRGKIEHQLVQLHVDALSTLLN